VATCLTTFDRLAHQRGATEDHPLARHSSGECACHLPPRPAALKIRRLSSRLAVDRGLGVGDDVQRQLESGRAGTAERRRADRRERCASRPGVVACGARRQVAEVARGNSPPATPAGPGLLSAPPTSWSGISGPARTT
jgi:hypothetical protein